MHRTLLRLKKGTSVASRLAVKGCIAAIDQYHSVALDLQQNARAVDRTKRKRIPEPVRRRIIARQGNKCMYCGINLLNLSRNRRHIDHAIPVEHGGPNEESNYQALCNRCNSRKGGHQTDEEFRQRYHEALGPTQPT